MSVAVQPAGKATDRLSRIRAIQASRRKVAGLSDEEAWRAFLGKASGGETSVRAMTEDQMVKVLRALNKASGYRWQPVQDAKPRPAHHPARVTGPEAGKARALWISAYHLGVVSDASESALNAYARRQTKVDALQWVKGDNWRKVIEGLKAMLARPVARKGGGVSWRLATGERQAIVAAQITILQAVDALPDGGIEAMAVLIGLPASFADYGDIDFDRLIVLLGPLVRAARGLEP